MHYETTYADHAWGESPPDPAPPSNGNTNAGAWRLIGSAAVNLGEGAGRMPMVRIYWFWGC